MAEKSSFFNSVNGDRKYQASDFASYFHKFIKNGYFPDSDISLKVVENEGMTTILNVGAAYINGYMYENVSDLLIGHNVADGVLNRIDRIVIQLDYEDRIIRTVIKAGLSSSSPVAPELQRDEDIYELGIADVYIGAGATTISQANITDLRGNGALCGTVNNLFAMQNVDASAVLVNDPNNNYDSSNLEAVLDELKRPLNVYRSGIDSNDKYTIVEWKRSNGTLYRKSVLSDLVNSVYTKQTLTYYGVNGITVTKTEIYNLEWNSNGDIQNEVKQ